MFFSYFYSRQFNLYYKKIMKKCILPLLFVFAVISHDSALAQSADKTVSIEQRKKELREKEEKRKEEERAAIEDAKRQHLKIQEKKTRRRMKKSKKRANKINEHKKDGFLKRLFTK